MIDCTTAVKQLWDFIEQDLTIDEESKIEEHLAFCKRCCGEVAFAEELRAVLKNSSKATIPTDAAERLDRFINQIEEADQ